MFRLFIYLILFLMVSCAPEGKKSSELAPAEIYKNFTVTYDENKEELEAKAQFFAGASWDRNNFEKTGGDAVELANPSTVMFSGKAMKLIGTLFTGKQYLYEQEGYLDETTWLYRDNRNRVYEYKQKMTPISFRRRYSRIDYEYDFKLYWEGERVKENEWVEVSMEGEVLVDSNKAEKRTIIAVAGEPEDEYVVFRSAQLKELKDCKVKITITRKSHIALPDVGKEEGFLNQIYIGKSFEAIITDEEVMESILGL